MVHKPPAWLDLLDPFWAQDWHQTGSWLVHGSGLTLGVRALPYTRGLQLYDPVGPTGRIIGALPDGCLPITTLITWLGPESHKRRQQADQAWMQAFINAVPLDALIGTCWRIDPIRNHAYSFPLSSKTVPLITPYCPPTSVLDRPSRRLIVYTPRPKTVGPFGSKHQVLSWLRANTA